MLPTRAQIKQGHRMGLGPQSRRLTPASGGHDDKPTQGLPFIWKMRTIIMTTIPLHGVLPPWAKSMSFRLTCTSKGPRKQTLCTMSGAFSLNLPPAITSGEVL